MEKEVKEPVNSVGKIYFGEWFLKSTSVRTDVWKKRVVEPTDSIKYNTIDSYIVIERQNIDYLCGNFVFTIRFIGCTRFLEEYFTLPPCKNVEEVKNHIDTFLARVDRLIVFT